MSDNSSDVLGKCDGCHRKATVQNSLTLDIVTVNGTYCSQECRIATMLEWIGETLEEIRKGMR